MVNSDSGKPGKICGYPQKKSARALNVIKCSLESDSHLRVRQLKEAKSGMFGEVSVRTVS